MRPMLRSLAVAWHFLLWIPIPGWSHTEIAGRAFAASMRWFPLIGVCIGLVLAVSDMVLSQIFVAPITNLLLVTLLVLMTGGLHQDGLADALDGLCGARRPEDRLAIMKDGRIGAMAATGLFLALGLRYAGLLTLPQSDRFSLLVLMPVVGRWAMVVTAYGSQSPRSGEGLAASFLSDLDVRDLVWATGTFGFVFLWAFEWLPVVVMGALLFGVARFVTLLSNSTLGGVTGDVLGATNELTEIVYLLMFPVLLSLEMLKGFG